LGLPHFRNRKKKLLILLGSLNLFDPFSIEYILGKIKKKIAAVLVKFAILANSKLNISI